jgi:hypothetical protein
LGTPTSGVLTNCTGYEASDLVKGTFTATSGTATPITVGTPGSILFVGSANIEEDNASIGWNTINKTFSVGDTTFTGYQVGITQLTPKIQAVTSTALASERNFWAARYGTTASAVYAASKARGTSASPTTVVAGDFINRMSAYGYDGAAYQLAAQITIGCEGTIGSGFVPGLLRIETADSAGVITTCVSFSSAQVATFSGVLKPRTGSATAGTVPIQMTSGTLLTTAVAGGIEFLTDSYYATITTGAARKEITLNDAALTSGKYPKITTNGRLTDGPTPLAGTKVYYVSDTSGGAVTRKLTFTDGILTAET